MSDKEDKRLQLYLEDSKEQLDGIENDILLLEKSIDELDDNLINRIFRSIHSVKGGAAFLGLKKIKELSHVTEDVLNEIRNKNIIPSHDDINILLNSSDYLKTMINDPAESSSVDIEEVLAELQKVLDGNHDETEDLSSDDSSITLVDGRTTDSNAVEIRSPQGGAVFSLNSEDIDKYNKNGFNIYLLCFKQEQFGTEGYTQEAIEKKLDEIGYILASSADSSTELPLTELITTVLTEELTVKFLEIPPSCLFYLDVDPVDIALSKFLPWDGEVASRETTGIPDLHLRHTQDVQPGLIEETTSPKIDVEGRKAGPHPEGIPHVQDVRPEPENEQPDWVTPFEADLTNESDVGVASQGGWSGIPDPHNSIQDLGPQSNQDILSIKDTLPTMEKPSQGDLSQGGPPQGDLSRGGPPRGDPPRGGPLSPQIEVVQQGGPPTSDGRPSIARTEPNPQPIKREEVKMEAAVETRSSPPIVKQNRRSTDTSGISNDKKEHANASNIRVDVNILDNLMNLAGELVLTRNQLNQTVSIWDKYSIEIAAQRLDSVTSELQETIMSTRMQPIGIVFNKFQRVVRDMSKKLDKTVNLMIKGEEVELDKTIIENISDPLTHLVRNAIDHGIETPAKRKMAGKPETGTLSLVAKHEAGHVIIEIIDDGAGIDANTIKDHALEKGLVDKNTLDEMSESEIYKLIFTPGFSTAKEVSDISGRGVGMDVVLTNMTQLGGTIDINTVLGKGTNFKIKLPLTLAIIPSLLITVNKENFAIPQVNLVELVRIPPAQVKKRLEQVGDAIVTRLRGKLLPVIRLHDFLGISGVKVTHPETEEEIMDHRGVTDRRIDEKDSAYKGIRSGNERRIDTGSSINIVVVSAGDFLYGIIVDTLMDSEEIVVKPLGYHLRDCEGYAGATILGDGSAALIIDVMGVANFMKLSHLEHDREQEEKLKQAQQAVGDEQNFLIIENAENEQFAVQLALIHRIERIKCEDIQHVGAKAVTKYREGTLMLFSIEEAIKVGTRKEAKHVFLILFSIHGREVSIMASSILDIVDVNVEIDKTSFKERGVIGSAIILDHITLVLDLFGLVKKLMPEWDDSSDFTIDEQSINANEKTVLVVEDTPFFREHIKSLLVDNGLNVITAEDGKDGLEVLYRERDKIDLILSDIEMPIMDGFEMIEKIREDRQFSRLKIIMLSSLSSEEDIKRARERGADEYLVKIDQELLIKTTRECLGLL